MPVKIEIKDSDLTYFSSEAKDELKKQMEMYSTEIIKESGRLEEALRGDKSTPEITRTLIKQAVTKYKDAFGKRKKSKKLVIIKILSTISIFLAGVFCDFDTFKVNTTFLGFFLVLAVIATISTTLMFIWEGDDR